jgi:hypothetical protein
MEREDGIPLVRFLNPLLLGKGKTSSNPQNMRLVTVQRIVGQEESVSW